MRLNFILLAGLVAASLFAEGCALKQTPRIERGYPSSFADGAQDLRKIYETPIPAQIRKTFDQTDRHLCSKDRGECPGCAFTVWEGGKRTDIFTKKFVVVGLKRGHFGGVEVIIVFEGVPKAFWLWLYDVDPDEYQLRSIEQLPEPLDKGLVRRLQAPSYQQYWL